MPPEDKAVSTQVDGPARGPRLLALICFGVAGVILLFHMESFNMIVDDAYISLRYSRNLLEGRGLVFNPGEKVEGYSNFLWVALLAGLMKLDFNGVAAARFTGLFFSMGALFMVAHFSYFVHGRSRLVDPVAALLLSLSGCFALWSGAGLENGLFVFAAVLGQVLYLRQVDNPSPGRGVAWGLAFAMAYFSRPDGGLFFAAAFFLRLFFHRLSDLRPRMIEAVAGGLAFTIPFLIHMLWRLHYYGDWLPNTFYVKAGLSPERLLWGLRYAWEFARIYSFLLLAPALLLFALKRDLKEEASLLFFGSCYLFYVVFIGGDRVFPYFRFLMVILPTLYLLSARGLEACWETLALKTTSARASVAVSLYLLVVCAISVEASRTGPHRPTVTDNNAIREDAIKIGAWLGQEFPEDTWTAMWRVGTIPYVSGLPTIDLLGLTDRHIGHSPTASGGSLPGHAKHDFAYALEREPTIIIYWDTLFDKPPRHLSVKSVNSGLVGFQELEQPKVRAAFERDYVHQIKPVAGKYFCYFIRKDALAHVP